jgi:dTDP-4-dehydrorhamnose 3,5-epimerase
VIEIVPKRYGDERGFFSETYSALQLANAGIDIRFVQENHSYSVRKGVLRGLHYQLSPRAQDKLLRVIRGAVYDVAVDIRRSSRTFGQWVGVEISADRWNQLLIPKGFAHGFVTLEDHTEVIYQVSDIYSPEHERAIRFDDPDIGVQWPHGLSEFLLSPKDRDAPYLVGAEVFS